MSFLERGLAAQDHRASLARIARRRQEGEEAHGCPGCGTELDVSVPAHASRCGATVRVVATAPAATPVPGRMERGPRGHQRSANERDAAGVVTVGELQRQEEAAFDRLPMVASCGVPGCGWTFAGAAGAAREAGRAHRAERHPEAVKAKRRFVPPVAVAAPEGRDIELDISSTELLAEPVVEPQGEDTAMDTDAPTNGVARKWTRETIIDAIRAWARDHDGEPPTGTAWAKAADGRPSTDLVRRTVGSWADAVEAAGFPRPMRGVPSRSGREPMGPETHPPASPATSTAVSEASRTPAVGTAERASPPEPPVPATITLAPPRDVFAQLGLTGDFAASAERVRTEAGRLRAQAGALDVIAAGIDQLEAA